MRITVTSPISGPDAFEFERMSVYEELGRPYRYEVFLLSTNRDLSLSPLLGEYLTVKVTIESGQERYFGGHIVKATALGGHGRSARYQVELRPWLSLLRDQAMCRIWQKVTIVDVLKDVASKAGFSVMTSSDIILSGREWEYVVQYRESDFNFFMRLVEQEGLHFFFRQQDKRHDLVLSDDLSLHDSAKAPAELEYNAESSTHDNVPDVFTHWAVHEQMRPTEYELDEYDYKNARSDLFVRSGEPAKLPKTGGKGAPDHDDRAATIFDYPGEYVDSYGGTELTMIRQQELRVDRQTATAGGNVRALGAGSLFKLSRHQRSGVDAQYAVTSMNLSIEAAPVESRKSAGSDFVVRAQFSVLNATIPFRLKRISPKPIIAGVQTAVVVGPKTEDIHTDDMGRIRVKFRWDRTGKEKAEQSEGEEKAAPEDSSCWIRVAQPWASGGFGFQFIPRVGDEVIVQFLEGDPDRPLVTGSLYNSVNKFPFTLPGKKTQSGVKTRSSKEGGEGNANIIRLEDDKGHEEFFVQAERNHTVSVKANRSVSVGGTEQYTVQKKQTIKIQNDKSEYVDLGYELTTKDKFLLTQGPEPNSGTTMKFEGTNVTLDVKGELTITRAPTTIRIDAAGNVAIEDAPSITMFGGGSSVTIGPEGVTVSGTMIKLNT